MKKVLLAPLAEGDLAEIWFYIAEDSPDRADQFVESLDEKFHILATQPEMGRARPELLPEVRSFPVARYIIFYRPVADGVQILRVVSGARDVDALF
jgi:toxin ParE1/3/4